MAIIRYRQLKESAAVAAGALWEGDNGPSPQPFKLVTPEFMKFPQDMIYYLTPWAVLQQKDWYELLIPSARSFRLKHDSPELTTGAIVKFRSLGNYYEVSDRTKMRFNTNSFLTGYSKESVEENPEWWEEIYY